MAEVSRDELRRLIDGGETFALVDALSPTSYAASHLPGAINIPPEWVDERARRRIPDRSTKVVVYCSGPTCESSLEVAERLIELGYRDVGHYAEGKSGWREAGLPLEGGRV
jgi:rhodanese-related sulfurtransferase